MSSAKSKGSSEGQGGCQGSSSSSGCDTAAMEATACASAAGDLCEALIRVKWENVSTTWDWGATAAAATAMEALTADTSALLAHLDLDQEEVSVLHPALHHNDGLDWTDDRGKGCNLLHRGTHSEGIRDKKGAGDDGERNNGAQGPQLDLLQGLDFPTPSSLLRTFPPPPADKAQWATFYHNCCPVRCGLPTNLAQPRSLTQDVTPDHVEVPGDDANRGVYFSSTDSEEPADPSDKPPTEGLSPSPEAGASPAKVASYVTQTESQLGPSFYALAPVEAAIAQRSPPWVGEYNI
jgi:hypothetical protein